MSVHSRNVTTDKSYSGEIPDGAVRMLLSLGIQATGKVTVGGGDPQPMYYGKNEYMCQGETSYTVESEEQDFEFVEDFVFMPSTIDSYMEAKFAELAGPMNTKLEDHETRIKALEDSSGENPQAR